MLRHFVIHYAFSFYVLQCTRGAALQRELSNLTNSAEFEARGHKPLLARLKTKLLRHVNILNWLPRYTQQDGVGDVIAGITVGLTMMPQSIAYASLAGFPPQFGLYSAFLGSYLYVFFGTIKEVSIGPTAIMSLLTYEFTHGLSVEHMVVLTFLAGCVELAMGLLNLGFLIDFISAPVTSGFTSAYSVIIIVSQLKSLLGLRKFKTKGFVDSVIKLVEHVHETRLWDALLGIACIACLLVLRKVKDIPVGTAGDMKSVQRQKKVKKMLWFISISRNAFVVLMSAVFAVWCHAAALSPFTLSGTVESGLPSFTLPAFTVQEGNSTVSFPQICSELGLGILVIPVVAVLANVAIAKAFASGPSVDATQEMLTLGICNIVGSCVRSMPTCGAFTRSAVSNASGARTPMVGLYSGTIIVLALSLLTPYFYYIPRSTLAAVLISAVIFMIDWQILKSLWKCNKPDLFLVILTFVSCLALGVEVGLLIGVATNLLFLLYPWARPTIGIVRCKAPVGGEYVMVTPDIGLMYPAADHLNTAVYKAGMDQDNCSLPIVINCAYFKGIDYTTAQALKVMHKTLTRRGQLLVLLNVKPEVKSILQSAIPCCDTEEDVLHALFGDKLDLARSETLPVFARRFEDHEVTVENVDNLLGSADPQLECVPLQNMERETKD